MVVGGSVVVVVVDVVVGAAVVVVVDVVVGATVVVEVDVVVGAAVVVVVDVVDGAAVVVVVHFPHDGGGIKLDESPLVPVANELVAPIAIIVNDTIPKTIR